MRRRVPIHSAVRGAGGFIDCSWHLVWMICLLREPCVFRVGHARQSLDEANNTPDVLIAEMLGEGWHSGHLHAVPHDPEKLRGLPAAHCIGKVRWLRRYALCPIRCIHSRSPMAVHAAVAVLCKATTHLLLGDAGRSRNPLGLALHGVLH